MSCSCGITSSYFALLMQEALDRAGSQIKVSAVSGACDGLFGIGGPLMVLFFLGQTHSKEEYLGSVQAVFLVNLVYGTMMRMVNHILTPWHLSFIGVGMVCILAGLLAANKIVDRLDGEKIKKITYVVIGLSGIMNLL